MSYTHTHADEPYTEQIRNGRVRSLLCEGVCSKVYVVDQAAWVAHLRASGYTPDQVRAHQSSRLTATNHRETRRVVDPKAGTATVYSACMVCNHERQYGIEEL